ncbi:MAG: carbohydrate porin [Rhodocyclaceae bacterium]|nr:carbohydrate porin [Rhodocyclaceae bacterium]
MKNCSLKYLVLTLSILFALAGSCLAEDELAPNFAEDTLSGDWNGQRTVWFKDGLTIEGTYKVDHLRNLRGGLGKGGSSMRNLDLKLRADLDRLRGWNGVTAYVHVLDDRGTGLNAARVGSLMGVTNIEVPVSTTRIFHAWVQKTFMEEQWSLLAGLYPIDSEFSVMDSAGIFLHPAYGPPADLSLTRGPSIFNNSAVGLRLKWQSHDKTRYAMGAVLDGIPGDPRRPKGTHIRFDKGDGSFTIAEIGWTPVEQGHVFHPADPARVLHTPELKEHEKYEGHSKYAAGLWRYSTHVDDLFAVDAFGNPEKRLSWGAYLLAERTLWSLGGESDRHVTGFIRHAFTDGDSTPIRSQTNLGLNVRGPIASRTDDVLGLAWTQGRLASKYRAARWRDNGIATATGEDALELTYRAALTPWLAVQPNLQRIRHPGGDASVKNATVAGFRLEVQL